MELLQGKKLVFVTNNSTKSRKGYLGKFTGLGLNVSAEEIYSSSYAAAAYLESINFPQDKKVLKLCSYSLDNFSTEAVLSLLRRTQDLYQEQPARSNGMLWGELHSPGRAVTACHERGQGEFLGEEDGITEDAGEKP